MGGKHHYGVDHHKEDMKHLFSDWAVIGKSLKGKFIYLFLDYDGTLTPIAATPRGAVTPARIRDLLRKLSRMSNCRIAIVSGRKLSDLEKRIKLKNIVYAGNHGFEIKGPKIKFKNPVPARYRRALEEILGRLKKELARIDGVIIEDKGFSLGVHYRLVSGENIPKVKNVFYSITLVYELKNIISVKTGKMALEIRPPVAWDKGKVVLWLLGRRLFAMRDKKAKVLPVYIGDDTTDEDAFESLQGRGITIFVGRPKKTKALFYLRDTEEVAVFLDRVLEIVSRRASWRKKR